MNEGTKIRKITVAGKRLTRRKKEGRQKRDAKEMALEKYKTKEEEIER